MGFGREVIASDLLALPRTVTHSCRLPRRSRSVDGGASASNLAGWNGRREGKIDDGPPVMLLGRCTVEIQCGDSYVEG